MEKVRIEEKEGKYYVCVPRDSYEKVPVFITKDRSQAELMKKYLEE